MKLTRGEDAQSTADQLLKAGWRSRDALVIYMGIRLMLPVILTSLVFLVVAMFHLPLMQLILSGGGIAIAATYSPPLVLKKHHVIAQSPLHAERCPTCSTCW